MIQKMNHNNDLPVRNRKWLVLVFYVFSISLNAQLNGSYTIDPLTTSTASSRVFKNWDSFFKSLHNNSASVNPRTDGGPLVVGFDSVSGPVTVFVKSSNTNVEKNALILSTIKGVNKTNTFEIDGNFQTLNYDAANAILKFKGADFVTLKNLSLVNANIEPAGIWLSNQSDNNTITNCTVNFPNLKSAAKSVYFFSMSTSESNPELAGSGNIGNGSFNTISNNSFLCNSKNGSAPYIAITLNGNSSKYQNVPQNNSFIGNKIQGFIYAAISQKYTNGNVISNNDITRSILTNSGSNILYVIYNQFVYSTNRSSEISKNTIHDIVASGNLVMFSYNRECFGNATNHFKFNENKVVDFQTNNGYGHFFYDNKFLDINGNLIQTGQTNGNWYSFYIQQVSSLEIVKNTCENVQQNLASGRIWNFYMYPVDGIVCNENKIIKNYSVGSFRGFYIMSNNGNFTNNEFQSNVIVDNSSVKSNQSLVISTYFDYLPNHFKVNRNYCVGNVSTGQNSHYGFVLDRVMNIQLIGNVIAGNYANSISTVVNSNLQTKQIYAAEIRNNTFQANTSSASIPDSSLLYLTFQLPNHKFIFTGNIVDLKGSGKQFRRNFEMNCNQFVEFNDNTYSLNQLFKNTIWSVNGGYYSDWADFKSSGNCGSRDNGDDPLFIDIAKNDWRPGAFSLQNNVPYVPQNELDCLKKRRNKIAHDRGGLEVDLDLAVVATNLDLPDNVCSGELKDALWVIVKNRFPFDHASGFKVCFSINGGPKMSTVVKKQIAPGDTAKIFFDKRLNLSQTGVNKITVFIEIPDDSTFNDTLTEFTYVKPVPRGSKLRPNASLSKTIYQPNANFDVTLVGQTVEYFINAPVGFTNSDYLGNGGGDKWYVGVVARCQSGNIATGYSLVTPSATSDLKIKFITNDASLEDSIITLFVKIVDNLNGCDTLIKRNILIYPSIVVDFSKPSKVCLGKKVKFDNLSTLRSGEMEFNWDFGTGNSAENSKEMSPEFVYQSVGMYKVKLTAKTIPYGYEFTDSVVLQVLFAPTAAFAHTNACENKDLTFTNLSTPPNASIQWDFGDNLGMSQELNPNYQYAHVGSFIVTLKVQWGGCEDTAAVRVYQLANPLINFTAENTCAGIPVRFINQTTWAHGGIEYIWDFSDNSQSTLANPEHVFNVSRTTAFNITLKAKISAGCIDSLTKQITVNEGPKTCDFIATPDYSFGYFGMKFEPMNALGVVGGAQNNVLYEWNIENEGQFSGAPFTYDLPKDGLYQVTMKAISESTGCYCNAIKTVEMNRSSAENLKLSNMQIFPNPTTGEFQIKLLNLGGIDKIELEIFDLNGAVVKRISTEISDSVFVDLRDKSDGVYLIKAVIGGKVLSSKVLKLK